MESEYGSVFLANFQWATLPEVPRANTGFAELPSLQEGEQLNCKALREAPAGTPDTKLVLEPFSSLVHPLVKLPFASAGQIAANVSEPRPPIANHFNCDTGDTRESQDSTVLDRAEALGSDFVDSFKWQTGNEEANTINIKGSSGINRSLVAKKSLRSARSGSPATGSGSKTADKLQEAANGSPCVGLSQKPCKERVPSHNRSPSPCPIGTLPPAPPYQAPQLQLMLGDQYQKRVSELPLDGFVEIDSDAELSDSKVVEPDSSLFDNNDDEGASQASLTGHREFQSVSSPDEVSCRKETPHLSDDCINELAPATCVFVASAREVDSETRSSQESRHVSARSTKERDVASLVDDSIRLPLGDLQLMEQLEESPLSKTPVISVRTPRTADAGVSPRALLPKSPSTRSASSADSSLPMEFSDVDEPPTQAIASAREPASFSDTHEIPIDIPKMGARTCVTQYRYTDSRRELSLGLRGMNCIGQLGGEKVPAQAQTSKNLIYVNHEALERTEMQSAGTLLPVVLEPQGEQSDSNEAPAAAPEERKAVDRRSPLRSSVRTPRSTGRPKMRTPTASPCAADDSARARGYSSSKVSGEPTLEEPPLSVEAEGELTQFGAAQEDELDKGSAERERSFSGLSISSSEISLPPEFPDIEDSLACEHEVAAFSNTHEVPIELPKMSKRKCVTQWTKSSGQREVSLGLRAMSTLDSTTINA